MAVIRKVSTPKPLRMERFLGLNEDTTGDTQLQIGESPNMTNFRLSENYKLKKREGYTQLFTGLGEYRVRGMFNGFLNSNNEFLFNLKQKIWREQNILQVTDSDVLTCNYNSLDVSSYVNVDVIKTTALNTPLAGTTGLDGYTIYNDKNGTTLTEVSSANIDLTSSAGKYYYHTDKTIWIIVAKGTYADIETARIGLGISKVYIAINYAGSYQIIADADMHFFSFEDTVTTHPATGFIFPSAYPSGIPADSDRDYTRKTKVYMLNGNEYYSWDGTTFEIVAGYAPLVRIGTPNTGGGTAYEVTNLLTGMKRQKFNGLSAANTVYQLAETNLDSTVGDDINYVYAENIRILEGTADGTFTKNLTNGTVRLNGTGGYFEAGTNNVEIYWTKGVGDRADITANKYATIFGGQNDTRVFIYGEGFPNQNRYHYTELADGAFSADYFPATFFQEVGSPEFSITGIIRQYDRQIIFTNEAAYYSFYETTLINDIAVPSFPTFPLNQAKGNIALGQVRLIQNNPYSVWVGVQEWIATNVRDERNATYISKRVQKTLDSKTLSTVKTEDWEKNYEYWMAFDNMIIIHNYRLNTWYKFELDHNVTTLYIKEDNMYFGTDDGQIMKFDVNIESDNGNQIDAHWESGFYDFDAEYLQKFIDEIWASIQPFANTSVDITFETDRDPLSPTFIAKIRLFSFEDIDFSNFTFLTSIVPQPFRFKIKAKKFVYFKIKLDNNTDDEKLTILSLNLGSIYTSKSR